MKNEKKKEVKVLSVKEIRLNNDLMFFVESVMNEKLNSEGNKEKIREMYEDIVGLKFNNIERVINRSNREGLKEIKERIIKEKGLKIEDVKEFELILKNLSRERRNRNYISVKV